MSAGPTWDAVFAVMAAASVGDPAARVTLRAELDIEDEATRLGIALNLLLDDLALRTSSLQAQLEIVQQQRASILALSTPVLVVDEHVLLIPIIGSIDADRGSRLIDSALEAINTTGAGVLLIDLTGVVTVDEVAAKALADTVRAAGVMGATTLLCGIRARVAAEMNALAGDLSSLKIVSNLRTAVAEARLAQGSPNQQLSTQG